MRITDEIRWDCDETCKKDIGIRRATFLCVRR
jgi:hypothetical protein